MQARKWKRSFMTAEHDRRALKRKTDTAIFELQLQEICHRREISLLKAQHQQDRKALQNQMRIINQLQKTLKDHQIAEPSGTQVASFKTCRADDTEICPLSLMPVNASPPPYDPKHPTIHVEPRKPHHKCAELHCGHRFNALWLLFHFVSRRTFRCPICRSGHEDFQFHLDLLPRGLVERVKDVMGCRE